MCIPKKPKTQPTPAQAPSAVPSIQSASSIQLGGDNAASPRGAGGLGRLLLRFGGGSGRSSAKPKSRSQAAATSAPGAAPIAGFDSPAISNQPAVVESTGSYPIRGFDRTIAPL